MPRPATPSAHAPPPSGSPRLAYGPVPVVLVIDDDPRLREMLHLCFEPRHVLLSARSGEEGLLLLEKEQVDVVILDIFMPGIGGLETLRRIRDEHPNLPVLVLTARSSEDLAIACCNAGASRYMTKPFDPEDLAQTVQNLLVPYERRSIAEALQLDWGALPREVRDAISYIMRHYRDPNLNVHRIAHSVGYSYGHLEPEFKKGCGLSVWRFVEQVRVAQAQHLLTETHLSIGKVGRKVGFADRSHFSRVFSKVAGTPPGAYRSFKRTRAASPRRMGPALASARVRSSPLV